MKAFIAGIPEQYLQETVYLVLENGLYLKKDSRVIHYNIETARTGLCKTKGRIDLLVLGGGIMQNGALTPALRDNYGPALNLAKINKNTPSIIIVNPNYDQFLDSVKKISPPDCVCTFDEFKEFSKEKLEQILRREKVKI